MKIPEPLLKDVRDFVGHADREITDGYERQAVITYAGSAKWVESKGADRYRRGLYTFFQRTSPYPMLATFDAPDTTECAVKRQTSNTPIQSLTLWNDVTPSWFRTPFSVLAAVLGVHGAIVHWRAHRATARAGVVLLLLATFGVCLTLNLRAGRGADRRERDAVEAAVLIGGGQAALRIHGEADPRALLFFRDGVE